MKIGCSHCKTQYSLTEAEIKNLNQSIYPCKNCGRFIKIAFCPRCSVSYSITFVSAEYNAYRFTCMKCGNEFRIDFPVIREPGETKTGYKNDNASHTRRNRADTVDIKNTKVPPKNNDMIKAIQDKTHERHHTRDTGELPINPGDVRLNSLDLREFLSIAADAFTLKRMKPAFLSLLFMTVTLFIANAIENAVMENDTASGNILVRTIIHFLSPSIIVLFYVAASAVIAKTIMDNPMSSGKNTAGTKQGFIRSGAPSVFTAVSSVLVLTVLSFVVFIKIPVVGPVYFSLMFLPVYIISAALIIGTAVGLWFLGPVIAESSLVSGRPLRSFWVFIKKHNLYLIYVILIMTVTTTLIFTAVHLVHYGSMRLSIGLAGGMISENLKTVFASIPTDLLTISELSFLGAEAGLLKSLIGELFLSYKIGGYILGVILSGITLFLFASFISFTASISAHAYLYIERSHGVDRRGRIGPLAVLVLILLILLLFKKIYF